MRFFALLRCEFALQTAAREATVKNQVADSFRVTHYRRSSKRFDSPFGSVYLESSAAQLDGS